MHMSEYETAGYWYKRMIMKIYAGPSGRAV